MNHYIDTHAHLYDDRFEADRDDVIQRAVQAGVEAVVAVGICRPSSLKSVELAHRYPSVWATVGIHPNEANLATLADWDEIVRLAHDPRVVGIGETGLDRHWHRCPFATQQEWFARHLELGRIRQLAVVIHAREADADVLNMLRHDFEQHGPVRGVLHSFTGLAETVVAAVHMGLYVSIAGMVTYPKAQEVRTMAATIPLDRLLIETDCPFLAPQAVRGRRCEPAHVVHTAAMLAELHSVPVATLAAITTRNARALFGLSR